MAVADELLAAAELLAATGATQASIRRSISTSYDALFHLLVQEAAARWQGTGVERAGLERAFNHGSMKSASRQFADKTWADWYGASRVLPDELKRVAYAFIELQDTRHLADYDNHRHWSLLEARAIVFIARHAFQDWRKVATNDLAGCYLLAMLLGKQR